MAREYSSKRSSRRGSGMPQQVIVMVVTFILGYFTASIFDVDTLSHWMTTQVLEGHESKPSPAHARAPKEHLAPKPKFEFYTLLANEKGVAANQAAAHTSATVQANTPNGANNNSNIAQAKNQPTNLTTVTAAATTSGNIQVNKPHLTTRPPVVTAKTTPAKPSIQMPTHQGNFVVQVAAFKTRQDAEHLKGLLILKGFEVAVVPTSSPAQGAWFRVVIGPYPNRVLAQKAQVILAKTERLNGMVRSAGG